MKYILPFSFFLMIFLHANAQSWIMQNVGFHMSGSDPFQISIIDANTVWVSGDYGVASQSEPEFSRTTDGGANWIRGTVPLATDYAIFSIAGIDANTAFIVTSSVPAYGSQIFKTTDGGTNWNQIGAGEIFIGATSGAVNAHFWNANEGIIIGDPLNDYFEMYTTADAGNSWTAISTGNMPTALIGEFTVPKAFEYKDSIIWFGTSKGRIFKSVDRGLNWTVHSTGKTGLTTVSFLDDMITGVASVYNGNQYFSRISSDGGESWSANTFTGPSYFFVKSIPGTTFFVSVDGNPPYITGTGSSYSLDSGKTWIAIDTAGDGTTLGYGWLAFYDINTGWAGGTVVDSLTDGIYKWNPGNLGIHNPAATSAVRVFPNPANEYVTINSDINFSSENELLVYDINGTLMKKIKMVGETNFEMSVADLSPGIYNLILHSGNKINESKFVVSR